MAECADLDSPWLRGATDFRLELTMVAGDCREGAEATPGDDSGQAARRSGGNRRGPWC